MDAKYKSQKQSKYFKNDVTAYDYLGSFILLLYFSCDFAQLIITKIVGTSLTEYVYSAIFFISILLFAITRGKEYFISTIICYTIICVLFSVTLIIHPEYLPWYFERTYGIQRQFLNPLGGIWAFLVISIIRDRKMLYKVLELAICINFLLLCYQFGVARMRGFWYDYDQNYKLIKLNYNMGFGYNMVFVVVFCIANAILHQKKLFYIPFFIGLIAILLEGSRGPIICILISLCLIFLYNWRSFDLNKKRILILICIIMSPLIYYILFNYSRLLEIILSLLSRAGIESRTITSLINGELTEGSGREAIAEIVKRRIVEGGLFGNGVFGERTAVGTIARWGYAHNFFLEIYAAFGYIGGTLVSIGLIAFIIYTAYNCRDPINQVVFITFFSCTTKLLISDSFWFNRTFWALLALMILWRKQNISIKPSKQRNYHYYIYN